MYRVYYGASWNGKHSGVWEWKFYVGFEIEGLARQEANKLFEGFDGVVIVTGPTDNLNRPILTLERL